MSTSANSQDDRLRKKARLIAFYLPQFHPIPENDKWWGKGFTEWTNTAKAKPLFPGHYQPHIPADLGFYDLRVPETRIAQAEMARSYGIEAFCYYHYWFAGKRLLERPFSEVLKSGQPDFPFCLCWANQTWSGIWHGAANRILIEQRYPGIEDHQKHFEHLIEAFSDHRYVSVDGKPLLLIYWPQDIPQVKKLTDFWRELAGKAGLKGLYLVGYAWNRAFVPQENGFDGSITEKLPARRPIVSKRKPIKWIIRMIEVKLHKPTIYSYKSIMPKLLERSSFERSDFPCVIPNWDNTPRSGENGLVLHGSTPELFRVHLRAAIGNVNTSLPERKIIFIKSWNEWAEGNHLEPDLKFGKGYLEVIKEEVETRTHQD
jgi:hypothetical protein